MFVKKRRVDEKQVLCGLLPFLEEAVLSREVAEQMLEKLCGLLGETVDCVVSAAVKGREEFLFMTLPEDEARYYRKPGKEGLPPDRSEGRRTLRTRLEIKDVLEGWWLFEVPEHASEEEISAYLHIAAAAKFFLYGCLLAQEYGRQAETDCFTGLPACSLFEQDIYRRLSRKERGFLVVARGSTELPKPYREDGINSFLINMADICTGIHPDGVYRIGPDMVAVLCREEKEETLSLLQELMRLLPESIFFMVSLSELEAGGVYTQIQKGMGAAGREKLVLGGREVFPVLPVFREGI